jgi:hypothetical protein
MCAARQVGLLVVVVLLLVLPYALIYRIFEASPALYCRRPRASLTEEYESLQTGDLVFFRTAHPVTTASLTKAPFSHAGVVLREGGLVYFSETTGGSDYMPQEGGGEAFLPAGAVVAPLLPRLKNYRGSLYLAKLRAPLGPEAEAALKDAAEAAAAAQVPYPGGLQFLVELVLGAKAAAKLGGRHCFAHSTYLLEAAGVLTPGELGEVGGAGLEGCRAFQALPEKEGGPYFPLKELLYDV